MERLRVRVSGWLRITLAASLGLVFAAAPQGVAWAARPIDPLLQPTPLILKDGRIANVSVHVVPFGAGRSELAADTADELAVFSRRVGTDCFLTAQVIGHIASDEVAEDDTLNAHRLARSRADTVQASLIGSGLPAKAIASVWDWQFMVRDARVTLWVFQLTRGEDCEGRPLEGDLVADASTSERGASPTETRTIVSAVAPAERSDAPAERSDAPTERSDAPTGRSAAPAVAGQPTAAGPVARAPAPTTASEPTSSPTPAGEDVRQPAAETPPAPTTVAAKPPAAAPTARSAPKPAAKKPAAGKEGKVVGAGDGSLVITFPTNSSYFPAGTPAQLRKLLADVDTEPKASIVLRVAVSGSAQVIGANSALEAARYNRWIAERRIERVRAWLVENIGDDKLDIRQEFRANDDTRRVIVRVVTAG